MPYSVPPNSKASPKPEKQYKNTRHAPPASHGSSTGISTSQNRRHAPAPSVCAAQSRAAGTERKP